MVCRCFSAWNVSTATGTGWPLASPNGPDPVVHARAAVEVQRAFGDGLLQAGAPGRRSAVGMTYRASYFAIASSRYISYISSSLMPTDAGMSAVGSRPRLMSRMYARIAASLCSTRSTDAVSPAVNSPARYSIGMRSA